MTPTQKIREAGQSLWLDHITRGLLTSGTLRRYVDELGVTGLTSNPTIFANALEQTRDYDAAIEAKLGEGKEGEELFFELAIEDLRRAADLFAPAHRRTGGLDGWVSLEVSPRLACDAESTLRAAVDLHRTADRPNLFIKVPGTPAGLEAVEVATFAGVPVNVTLLFSSDQYLAAADAYLRGLEQRVGAGLDPAVTSVASVFVSRWDTAVAAIVPAELRNRLGIALSRQTYAAYRDLLASERWLRLQNEGARPQRLLWASTGTKDADASDTLYVDSLVAPLTVDTIPEATLHAFADHGAPGPPLTPNGGEADELLAAFAAAGVDAQALAQRLQADGAAAFDAAWSRLMDCVAGRCASIAGSGASR